MHSRLASEACLGFLTGVGLKLAASLLMTFYFVKALIN